ncbi:MAG: 50S ribosomal protein L14 [Candidatus Diapherotrites archaeon]|nr:50S ribosomal protein L14 [Candidatus Diapherotrites archaeon]
MPRKRKKISNLGKAISASVPKCIPVGAQLHCDDNSGAKVIEVIGVVRYKGRKDQFPSAGIGDIVIVTVKKGRPDVRKTVEMAVIIRQKQSFRRPDGLRVKFEDNAAVLVNESGMPKGTEIKGVVAKEVAEKWPKVAGIASSII